MNFESLKIKEEIEQQKRKVEKRKKEIEQQKREAERWKRKIEKLENLFTVEGMKQFGIDITKEQEEKIRKWAKEPN